MDRPRHNSHHLAVMNKIKKKTIKKIPLHQPTLKIRPAIAVPPPTLPQPSHNNLATPTMHPLPFGSQQPMMSHGDSNISSESPPVSVCMRSLQSSDSRLSGNQMKPSHEYHSPRFHGYSRDSPILPSPRLNGPPDSNGRGILPSPVSVHMRYTQRSLGDSGPERNQMQPSREYQPQPPPHFNGSASSVPLLASPRFNGRGILPSHTSQYLLQQSLTTSSPPPLTPTSITFSSMAQPGILGPRPPCKFPQPPASPLG